MQPPLLNFGSSNESNIHHIITTRIFEVSQALKTVDNRYTKLSTPIDLQHYARKALLLAGLSCSDSAVPFDCLSIADTALSDVLDIFEPNI